MVTAARRENPYGTLLGWLLPVVFVLVPYLFAVVTGTP
jgi:hypothetical protein